MIGSAFERYVEAAGNPSEFSDRRLQYAILALAYAVKEAGHEIATAIKEKN